MTTAPQHILCVCGYVSDASGGILLIRSPRRGWELPGGQVECGESVLDALRREIREEAGVEITAPRLASLSSNIGSARVILGFRAHYLRGRLRPSAESEAVKWMRPETARRMIVREPMKSRFVDFASGNGRLVHRVYRTLPFEDLGRVFL